MLRLTLLVVLVTASIPESALAQPETADGLGAPRNAGGLPPPPAASSGYETAIPTPRAAAASGLEGEAPIPANIARRLRLLSTSLDILALRGGTNIGDGIAALVTAGIGFGIGAYAKHQGETSMARYLFVFGGVGLAQAGLAFARPRADGYASQFSVMPMTTQAEVLARLEYGERALEHIARVSRGLRLADGAMSVGVSLGTIPLLLGGDGFDSGEPFDWIIIVSAGLSATMGLVTMIQRSDAERRWITYSRMTDEMERQSRPSLTLRGVAPWVSPTGFGTVTSFAF